MTPDPLDQEQQRAFRELDQSRRTLRNAQFKCYDGCACQQEDAMTTPLDLEDVE